MHGRFSGNLRLRQDLEGRFPGAEAAYERLLTLPLFSAMTDRDVDDVVAALDKVTATYRAG